MKLPEKVPLYLSNLPLNFYKNHHLLMLIIDRCLSVLIVLNLYCSR